VGRVRELLVEASPGERRAALFEAGVPTALWVFHGWQRSRVGEIHLARIVRILPALPGAFVALADGSEALLSEEDARDLAPAGRAEAGIAGWLQEGAAILVQVHRDAAHGKAAGVCARIALAGERLDLLPTTAGIRFAHAVPSEVRAEIAALLPAEPALRIRNAVEPGPLVEERAVLLHRWETLRETARRAAPPALIERAEGDLAALFDELRPRPAALRAADPRGFAELRGWLRRHDERLAERLVRDEAASGEIDAAFAEATAPEVALPGGGRLTIEIATAATLIDVDLGPGAAEREGAARRILAANREAAAAAARQIRLRGLAGPIVIDFVSMRHPRHRDEVKAALAQGLAGDPAEPQLLGWTRLGHFELTRKRRRTPVYETLMERTAEGGWRRSAVTTALAALRQACREAAGAAALELRLHPDAAAELAGRAAAALEEFQELAGFRPTLVADPALPHDAFDIRRPRS
jgi:ribonuclease G